MIVAETHAINQNNLFIKQKNETCKHTQWTQPRDMKTYYVWEKGSNKPATVSNAICSGCGEHILIKTDLMVLKELSNKEKNYLKAALRELENCMPPNEERAEVQRLQERVDGMMYKQ